MTAFSELRYIADARSDQGLVRPNNEDRVLYRPDLALFGVIDGMGGHAGGERAAAIAAEMIEFTIGNAPLEGVTEDLLCLAITTANNRIFEEASREPHLRGMGCVLTIALLAGGRIHVGHVGDSRMYRFHQRRAEKLTHDHSPVGEMEDSGNLSEEEAMGHALRNEIFRNVGTVPCRTTDKGFIEYFSVPFENDCGYLLCTDGLTDVVPRAQIIAIIGSFAGDPNGLIGALIDRANEASKDNVSAVWLEGGDFPKTFQNVAVDIRVNGIDYPDPTIVRPDFSGTDETPISLPENVTLATPAAPVERTASTEEMAIAKPMVHAGTGRSFRWLVKAWWVAFILGVVAGVALIQLTRFVGLRRVNNNSRQAGKQISRPHTVVGRTGQYRDLESALKNARDGDTIELEPGEYKGSFRLRTGVIIQGSSTADTVLRSTNTGASVVVAQNVERSQLVNVAVDATGSGNGIEFLDSKVQVEGCEISGAGRAGIEVRGVKSNGTIRKTSIHNNEGAGVKILNSSGAFMEENIFAENGKGSQHEAAIVFETTSSVRLQNNRFRENIGGNVAVLMPQVP